MEAGAGLSGQELLGVVTAVEVVGLLALIGFFKTRNGGYGPFNTGTLILILILTMAPLLALAGYLTGRDLASLLLSVAGFAGGLLSNRQPKEE